MEQNDLKDLIDELKTLNQTHKLIAGYLRLMSNAEIEKSLKDTFTSNEEIRVYELSDGNRTTRDIEDLIGVSRQTVSNLWKKWEILGLVEEGKSKKPYKAKFSIIDLALGNKKKGVKNGK